MARISIDLSEGWEIRSADGGPWRRVRVPSSWHAAFVPEEEIRGLGIGGVPQRAVYRRRLRDEELRAAQGGAGILRFHAVATEVEVSVDGVPCGAHSGDYLPFDVDVTGALERSRQHESHSRSGTPLVLEVRVDALLGGERRRPGEPSPGHIGKGFHDVLSLQHAGIWQRVELRCCGPVRCLPEGVGVAASPESGRVRIRLDLATRAAGTARVELRDPEGRLVASDEAAIPARANRVDLDLSIADPRPWSLESPLLYRAHVELRVDSVLSERHDVSFGFRTLRPGGDGTRLLLNGVPIFLRGVLHWGHEPATISPAPAPDELRATFEELRARGFNGVCFCMWLPPPWLYDLADRVGLLLWQLHPFWKCDMSASRRGEILPLVEGYLRRTRNHPSVALLSLTCEQECVAAELVGEWLRLAREDHPDVLLQPQSAFLHWAASELGELHDEHTYESGGRWLDYLRDLRRELATRPARPFLLGETGVQQGWIDGAGVRSASGDRERWWWPAGLDAIDRHLDALRHREGGEAIVRARERIERFALESRRFQVERLREWPGCGGFVANHLRDVPRGPTGWIDDLGHWRAGPARCRPWLGDVALVLKTPGRERAHRGDRVLRGSVAVANDSHSARCGSLQGCALIEGRPRVALDLGEVRAAPGEVAQRAFSLDLPPVSRWTPLELEFRLVPAGVEVLAGCGAPSDPHPTASWRLWILPPVGVPPRQVSRGDPRRLTEEATPLFEERRYSSGWGLPVRSGRPRPPDLARDFPGVPAAPFAPAGGARGATPRVWVVRRWCEELERLLEQGGRALLLCSVRADGGGARFVQTWATQPLACAGGPFEPRSADALVDLLDPDLSRHWLRAVPVTAQGIEDRVEPWLRLLHTHDCRGEVEALDVLFSARVGDGMIAVSGVDASTVAGRATHERILRWLASPRPQSTGALRQGDLHGWRS